MQSHKINYSFGYFNALQCCIKKDLNYLFQVIWNNFSWAGRSGGCKYWWTGRCFANQLIFSPVTACWPLSATPRPTQGISCAAFCRFSWSKNIFWLHKHVADAESGSRSQRILNPRCTLPIHPNPDSFNISRSWHSWKPQPFTQYDEQI